MVRHVFLTIKDSPLYYSLYEFVTSSLIMYTRSVRLIKVGLALYRSLDLLFSVLLFSGTDILSSVELL